MRGLAALILAGVLGACGVQGPPRPPRVEQPERVTDLAVAQVGRTFFLTFTLPQVATDGERLNRPLEVEIFRSIEPAGRKTPSLPSDSAPWVTLGREEIRRLRQATKVVYSASVSEDEYRQWRGASLTFAVRTLTRGFRRRAVGSELSNLIRATLIDVAGPVENFQVRATATALELSWTPPSSARGEGFAPIAAYHIFRNQAGQSEPFSLLATTDATTYRDTQFEFNQIYFYKVRAVFESGDERAETVDSAIVQILPRDTFAPAAPTGLSGIYTTEAVEVVWHANPEADLAGYNVSRREEVKEPERLNSELLPTPIYRDTTAGAGRKYFYRVSAVDLAGNESTPSAEVSVEAQ